MDARDLEATKNGNISVQSDKEEAIISLKKGTWSAQEDSLLINYISVHGEGRWNYVARDSGLNRTGKSCRLRWKNYLQPNVRRGNFTAEEQLRIAELHCLYGNRWSKMAEFLPGRTDNEIKNYWRTRVHKQAKQLKYDTNSAELREFVRNVWLPKLSQQIHASQCNNNNLGNVTMNYDDVVGFEALQMDHQDNVLSCEAVEAHQVMTTENVFMNSDCGLYSPIISSEFDLGQYYYDVHSPYIGCSDNRTSTACFSYGELSNIHQLNDDWYNFGHAHEIIRNN